MYGSYIKPTADFCVALIVLLLACPIFLVSCVVLAINNNGAPFFFQSRGGKDGHLFNVIKFKTMNDRKDKNGELLPDALRLTKVGKFFRKTSLDELPQLINVLKGDMSLVGPRPLISEYLELYNDFQKRRHVVRPGITGWAQINGRNNISWQRKFELDIWYVDNRKILLDIKILLLTLQKAFVPKDVNKSGEATTIRFNGKN
ncbi:sugar transferase [Mariniblastus sp.]|nr:sugar transferase [Mariniblastus sp.]MDC3225031.1 sugar transferase [Mariniblastus sp.]